MIKLGALEYDHDEAGNLIKRHGKGLLKSFPDKDSYLKYHLNQRTKTFNIFVHHVVWIIFNGPIPDGMTVDHVDNDKSNNVITNLQLLSRGDNSVKGNAKVWTICDPDGLVHEVYNMEQFCREHNLHPGHMRSVCKGNTHYLSHKGWTKS